MVLTCAFKSLFSRSIFSVFYCNYINSARFLRRHFFADFLLSSSLFVIKYLKVCLLYLPFFLTHYGVYLAVVVGGARFKHFTLGLFTVALL
jgi:hypothetical protein